MPLLVPLDDSANAAHELCALMGQSLSKGTISSYHCPNGSDLSFYFQIFIFFKREEDRTVSTAAGVLVFRCE